MGLQTNGNMYILVSFVTQFVMYLFLDNLETTSIERPICKKVCVDPIRNEDEGVGS